LRVKLDYNFIHKQTKKIFLYLIKRKDMLKVKEKYLHQIPPFSKIKLGEYSQKQLNNLPKEQKEEYCERIVKKKKNV
tara:strand:+ start:436 stop:666 length:231 start_codon:yes stop_codon:yes gene_type:complete